MEGLNQKQTYPLLMKTVSAGLGFEVESTSGHPFSNPEMHEASINQYFPQKPNFLKFLCILIKLRLAVRLDNRIPRQT